MTAKTEKSELTFAAIVDAALDMAAAQGLESLSLGQLAKRLGISKSGVFSRVGSREALQQAVLEEYDRRFVAAVFTPAMAQPRGLPRLNALVTLWIERACNVELLTGCIYVAGAFEFDDVESPLRAVLEERLKRWRVSGCCGAPSCASCRTSRTIWCCSRRGPGGQAGPRGGPARGARPRRASRSIFHIHSPSLPPCRAPFTY